MLFNIEVFCDRIIIDGTTVLKPTHVSQAEWDRFCSNVVNGARS